MPCQEIRLLDKRFALFIFHPIERFASCYLIHRSFCLTSPYFPSLTFPEELPHSAEVSLLSHHGFEKSVWLFPLRLRVKTCTFCERSLNSKADLVSAMRRPSSSLFQSFREPHFLPPFANPFRICSSKLRRSHHGLFTRGFRMVVPFRLRVKPEPRASRYLPFQVWVKPESRSDESLVSTRCFLPVPSWFFPSRNPCFVYPSRTGSYLSFISRGIFSKMSHQSPHIFLSPFRLS